MRLLVRAQLKRCNSEKRPAVGAYFAAAFILFIGAPLLRAEEPFNTVAVKINTQGVSEREVELTFGDSLVLIQDKLRKGEIKAADLALEIRKGWNEALETTIEDKIIDQRANEKHQEIVRSILSRAGQYGDQAKAMFERQVAFISRQLRQEMITAAGGEQELRAALKRRGQTMQDWEAKIPLELFRREVIGMELGRVVVRPTEIREFYDKHPDVFQQRDAWRLRRIRIAKAQFTSAENALRAANLLTKDITHPGDFEKHARNVKINDDPEFAEQGGLLTKDGKSDLPTGAFPFEEQIAEHLKNGEVSDPADSADWYVLVQRVSYKPAAMQPYEQASERAEAMAFSEKLKKKRHEMYDKLKDQSFIEILAKEPPKHIFESLQADPNQFVQPDGK